MKTSSQIRFVVIGSTDRQLEEMLRQGGGSVTFQPFEALAGYAHAGSGAPDALIVDLRDHAAVPETLSLAKRHHPQMGVVIVASQFDPTLMLEAMRAGVTEWVAEPVTAPSLTAAVQRVLAQRAPKASLGHVFAFLGAKGGVGTTTVAVNVATALAAMPPRKALLIDLHLAHGDAAVFLGAEPRFSTADGLENIHRLDEAYLKGLVTATKSGVHLLASADRPIVTSTESKHVRELIEFAAHRYSYVVLDVPRSDMTMLDSLEMASSIIVVANQELATVRRAGALALTLRQRYGKDRVGVVINRFDRNADIGREDVERVTGGSVRQVIPSDYRIALDGLNKGQPVVVQNHNRLATSFSSLARQLAGVEAPKPAKEERAAGLFGRLRTART
jgi:pilus assembly protein CpaE